MSVFRQEGSPTVRRTPGGSADPDQGQGHHLAGSSLSHKSRVHCNLHCRLICRQVLSDTRTSIEYCIHGRRGGGAAAVEDAIHGPGRVGWQQVGRSDSNLFRVQRLAGGRRLTWAPAMAKGRSQSTPRASWHWPSQPSTLRGSSAWPTEPAPLCVGNR